MSSVDTLVQQAIAAVKANRRADARRLLEQAIEIDQYNEQAWLYLSGCVDDQEEIRTCLENVLAINPNNQKAIRGLELLRSRAAPPPRPAPSGVPPHGPFSADPFAGSPFEAGASSPDYAPPPLNTSVEWGPPQASGLGAGRGAQSLSDEEYDQWLANLQLGGSSPTASPGQAFAADFNPTSGPFNAPVEYGDPYASAPAPDIYDPYSSPQSQSSYSSFDPGYSGGYEATYDAAYESGSPAGPDYRGSAESSYAGGYSAAPAGAGIQETSPANDGTRFSFRRAAAEPEPTAAPEDEISFEDAEALLEAQVAAYPGAASLTGEGRAAGPFGGVVLGSSLVAPATEQVFRLIPPEIQVAKGGASIGAVVIVGALAVLNVISLIVLLINLAGLGS